MKYLLPIFITAFFSTTVLAQGDAKAKNVLNKVTANLKALKSLKADFKISIKGNDGRDQGSKSGSVVMKGNKYVVKISGQEIYSDSKTVWTFLKESNEVQLSSIDDDGDAFTPSKLFTNFYDKEYAYKFITDQSGYTYIGLAPLKKSVQFDKIVLKISNTTNLVVGGTVYDKNGNVYKYAVYNYQKPKSI